jgi:flagellar biosynthesis protein FlhB
MADQNKTERATPRRRQKARERGQVLRSRELMAGLATMTAVLLLAWQLPAFAADWRSFLRHALDSAASRSEGMALVSRSHLTVFRGVVIAAGFSWLVACVSGVAQGGWSLHPLRWPRI